MNLKGVTRQTWVRIIVLFAILVNLISVSFFGYQLIPFNDEQLYEGISVALTVATAIWTTWKNNSFTKEAQYADDIMIYDKSKGDVK